MITLNGTVINPTLFPDATSQVWHLPDNLLDPRKIGNRVAWRFKHEAELFHLHQLSCLLSKYCTCDHKLTLHMPYLPYARQDKEVSNSASFALTAFAEIINSQLWSRVTAFDVHNPSETAKLIMGFENRLPNPPTDKYDVVVFPDKGAQERYANCTELPTVVGDKVRDQATGWITDYIFDEDSVAGKRVLVWDDLCDGGATFNVLGKSLGKAKMVDLYVSHGIFSKGIRELLKTYSRIITTDTCIEISLLNNRCWCNQSPKWRGMHDAYKTGKLRIQPHLWQGLS